MHQHLLIGRTGKGAEIHNLINSDFCLLGVEKEDFRGLKKGNIQH